MRKSRPQLGATCFLGTHFHAEADQTKPKLCVFPTMWTACAFKANQKQQLIETFTFCWKTSWFGQDMNLAAPRAAQEFFSSLVE